MKKRRLTVEAVVIDPQTQQVLLVRQGRTRHDWELPGGKVRKEESLLQGMVREVKEETAVAVVPRRLIGVFFIPDGTEVFHDFVFQAEPARTGGKPRPNPPEIVECGFFPLNDLPKPMRAFTVKRIREARNGTVLPLPVELAMEDWLP